MTRRAQHPAIDAVAELIRTRTEHLDLDDGTRVRIHVPCLLHMLVVHLHSSSSGAGGSSGGANTIPLNTQAWDLLVEIRYNTHAWAQLLDVDPKPYAQPTTPRPGKPSTPSIGRLLRAVTVTAATTAREPVADAILGCARRWAAQIETIVAGRPDQRAIRGARCPDCDASTVFEQREDASSRRDDGRALYRLPALVLVAARVADEPPTLCCLACGWHQPLTAAAADAGDAGVTAAPARAADTPTEAEALDEDRGQAA